MVALLSQPGATHDEWFHASSIWCGQGVRDPYCKEIVTGNEVVPYAITNINAMNCQKDLESLVLCPTQRGGTALWTNTSLYPKLFYFTLSWLVVPSVELSIALVRVVSALLITVVFALMMWLLPPRHRLVLMLVCLTTFMVTGLFLFASVNPSSWTTFGIGIGWLGIHAALTSSDISRRRKLALLAVGFVAWSMAFGSRSDSAAFLAVVIALIAIHLAHLHAPKAPMKIGGALAVMATVVALALETVTPHRPSAYIGRLFSFENGEPDNVTFFTHYAIQGLPNVLRSLGTVPTMGQVLIPDLVYVLGVAVFAACIGVTFDRRSRLQIVGALLIIASITLVIMVQVAEIDNRDQFGVEPRYSYPLLLVLVGWWCLLGPPDLYERTSRYLRLFAAVAVTMFSLTMFTVAERFIDRQTFGLRYLPEGPDQWWWSWLPVGPNVVVILAPIFLWRFFIEMRTLIEQDDHELIA